MTAEEYYAAHQHAFRKAFDFLNTHFPPGDSKWWESAADDLAKVYNGESQLTIFLLMGVWDYLNEEWKRRNKDAEPGEEQV